MEIGLGYKKKKKIQRFLLSNLERFQPVLTEIAGITINLGNIDKLVKNLGKIRYLYFHCMIPNIII